MKIVYINGDLFSSSSPLAHCVSRDFAMGAGIAIQFKKRFGRIEELIAQEKEVGEVASLNGKDRHVFYLITKERYFHKPTYRSLGSSLMNLRDHCLLNNVKELSIPKIGCGLDRLEWNKVSSMIEDIFHDVDIIIKVYVI